MPLTHTIAHRVGRYLERQGLLERDVENSYLASDAVDDDPMTPLLGHSITYRIAVGSQAGRKVFTLQTLPTSGDPFGDGIGKVAGSSLHAGVAARADERKKLEADFAELSDRALLAGMLPVVPRGAILSSGGISANSCFVIVYSTNANGRAKIGRAHV